MRTGTWNLILNAATADTVEEIVESTGFSLRTVRTYLTEMVKRGLVEKRELDRNEVIYVRRPTVPPIVAVSEIYTNPRGKLRNGQREVSFTVTAEGGLASTFTFDTPEQAEPERQAFLKMQEQQ